MVSSQLAFDLFGQEVPDLWTRRAGDTRVTRRPPIGGSHHPKGLGRRPCCSAGRAAFRCWLKGA